MIELLSLSEQFELPPGTKITDLAHLTELIEEHLSLNGRPVCKSEIPVWHNEIESEATEILHDPQYAFRRDLPDSKLMPNRFERIRFSKLFAQKTGLQVRFARIPHIVYLPSAFVLAGFYAIAIKNIIFGCTIVVVSFVTSFLTWLRFTSKECTIREFANAVLRDNFDKSVELSSGDIERFVAARFPNGLQFVTIPQSDDAG